MTRLSFVAWLTLFVALCLWGMFGFAISRLYSDRAEYVMAAQAQAQEVLRGESAARVRSVVESTKEERDSLESLMSMKLLDIVQFIESTAREAGAREVVVGNVTPVSLKTDPKGVARVAIGVQAQGSFVSLLRTLSLFETLTIPSELERFSLEYIDDAWHLSANLIVVVNEIK